MQRITGIGGRMGNGGQLGRKFLFKIGRSGKTQRNVSPNLMGTRRRSGITDVQADQADQER